MYLRLDEKVIDKCGVVHLTEERLSDGSKVYNILVGNVHFDCETKEQAESLFMHLINSNNVLDITVRNDHAKIRL